MPICEGTKKEKLVLKRLRHVVEFSQMGAIRKGVEFGHDGSKRDSFQETLIVFLEGANRFLERPKVTSYLGSHFGIREVVLH